MPYYRKSNRNYHRYRKRPTYSKYTRKNRVKTLVDGKTSEPGFMKALRYGTSAAGAVYPLAKAVQGILSVINSEDKYHDQTTVFSLGSGVAGNISRQTGIAQGDSDIQRNGNKILLYDMQVKYSMTINLSATQTQCKLLVICDKEFDGTAPTSAQMFNSTSPLCFLNKDNSKRFTVIREIMVNLDTQGQPSAMGRFYVKLPFHVFYDGATAGDSDGKENQIYLVFLHSEATNFPLCTAQCRIRYHDN